ncbi:MAG: hypothetical protein L6R39_000346 [Caloplaca ligustica]|nr:MAG: hypothetical protein L6R39_000346 [Caloplaca ligustica]
MRVVSTKDVLLSAYRGSRRIDQRDTESEARRILSGITGALHYRSSALSSDTERGLGHVYFVPREKESRAALRPDSVPFSLLFWLSMTCVPLSDGRVFDVSRDYDMRDRPHVTKWERGNQTTEVESEVEKNVTQVYRFKRIEDLMPGTRIASWARSIFTRTPELWWLYTYTPSPREWQEIERTSAVDHDPEGVSTSWIKTDSLPIEVYFPEKERALLWRSDIQLLALSILTLECSPRGFLFEAEKGTFFRRIVCPASSSLQALLLVALQHGRVSATSKIGSANVTKSLRNVIPMCSWRVDSGFSRELVEALFDLEQVFTGISSSQTLSLAIGVVFITSETFRRFIHKAIDPIDSCGPTEDLLVLSAAESELVVTCRESGESIKLAFDFKEVLGTAMTSASTSMALEQVLLATLRACLRSVLFQFFFDAKHLLDFVKEAGEIVYVSPQTEAPPPLPESPYGFWDPTEFFRMDKVKTRLRVAEEIFVRHHHDNEYDVSDDDDIRSPTHPRFQHPPLPSGIRQMLHLEHSDNDVDGYNRHRDDYGLLSNSLPQNRHQSKSRPEYTVSSSRRFSLPEKSIEELQKYILAFETDIEWAQRKTQYIRKKKMLKGTIEQTMKQVLQRGAESATKADGGLNESSLVVEEQDKLRVDLALLEEIRIDTGRDFRSRLRELRDKLHHQRLASLEGGRDKNVELRSVQDRRIQDGEMELLELKIAELKQQLLVIILKSVRDCLTPSEVQDKGATGLEGPMGLGTMPSAVLVDYSWGPFKVGKRS